MFVCVYIYIQLHPRNINYFKNIFEAQLLTNKNNYNMRKLSSKVSFFEKLAIK